MKYTCLSILAICYTLTASAQRTLDTLFYESFNGQTLDRIRWNVEATGVNAHTVNNEQQAYVDSAATLVLKKGMLNIHPIYQPAYTIKGGRKYDFVSGRINTRQKFEFTYGTASARIKMAAGDGLWPAFWALGEGKWPDCGEIDIMENIGNPTWVSHALHGPGYFGNTPLVQRAEGMDVTQWHIYSVNWTKDSLVFSIDNKVTYTVTRQMVEKYGRWAYDNPKFIILNFALGGVYPQSKNGVKEPYPGIPQSTVDKIKAGKADYLVDWVLVTKN